MFHITKKQAYHPIANMYPMMDKNEFNNLIGSMEDNGYDTKHPIIMYEDKILDGRNRYEAALEARLEPVYEVFKGTFDEAVEKSRQQNSFRRNLSKSQKAMIAAREIINSRGNEGKKLSVNKASSIHAVSQSYIKDAMMIAEADEKIAKNVFDGSMSIKQAQYGIDEIERLRSPNTNITVENQFSTDNQTDEIIKEFSEDKESAAKRVSELQDNYKDVAKKLKECEELKAKHST